MAKLTLSDVTKVYDDAQGRETAVDKVSLDIKDGELVSVVGPSGCGKSTTLRMIAGLETVSDGVIEIGDREVQELVPSKRKIAMVFQNYALYSTMSVRKNMGYGLKHSSQMSKQTRQEHVEEIAELLGIEDLLESDPGDLSGGQRQRVALGRALVREPDVFLLDEPLSNLDAKLRSRMRTELQRIQQEVGVTTLYVTHDQKEAMTMSDRLAIMRNGVLQQIAPPEEAYHHPVNQFVATFLGSPSMNIFEEVRVDERPQEYAFTFEGEELGRVLKENLPQLDAESVSFGMRPEGMNLHQTLSDGTFAAEVVLSEYQGNDNFVHLSVFDQDLIARAPPHIFPERGETLGVSINQEDIYVFDSQTGDSIKTQTGKSISAINQNNTESTTIESNTR